jgi:pimeloyl-ACP methyl ester carboxylesterase
MSRTREQRTQKTGARSPRLRCGCLGWTALGVLLLLILGTAGSLYESAASARALRRHPLLGKQVDLGEYRLHVYCTGERQDPGYTVVMESDSPGYSLDWSLVQPGVAEFSRVCSYDRAGYGWSTPGPEPRTVSRMAGELHALLEASGESAPYVLVGSGYGGMLVQVYAAQYPEQVAAIVLVDSLYADWLSQMPEQVVKAQARSIPILRGMRGLAQIGVLRLGIGLGLAEPPAQLLAYPPSARESALALGYGASHLDVAYKERISQGESQVQAQGFGPVPEVPLAVLIHGLPYDWMPPGVPRAARELAEVTWRERQVQTANSVFDSTVIVAEQSGHPIPLEQPEAVIEAVDWAIAATLRSAC